MKKKLYLFSLLLIMSGALFQLKAQEDTIIFVAPYDADDPYGPDNREVENIQFLERHGFYVQLFWPPNKLGACGQDTIDMLNEADLVIIGRSGGSTNFQQAVDVNAWDSLTSPQMLICQWKARRSRLKWFNSTAAGHENTGPPVAYAAVKDPDDTIFTYATLVGDSMGWCYPPHDFIRNDSTTNGDVLATWDANGILIARFDAGTPFYVGAVDTSGTPQGPRTYFGMGNDDTNDRYGVKFPNFFPLTKEAKKVYLAEICRMLGKPVQEPVWAAKDIRIAFVAPYDPADITVNREVENIKFLESQGFKVQEFWPPNKLGAVPQDTLDMLNAADLVIIGRSGGSTNFQQAVDVNAWDSLTSPQMLICQWKARRSRLKWFNSTAAGHENTGPKIAYATVKEPDDTIFSGVTLVGDSMSWFAPPPHDFIRNDSTTNGDILATWDTNAILIARFDAGTPFYVGAVDTSGTPQGPRTYLGMGNDDTNDRYGKKFPNFLPLTREAKIVYLAEISRMVGVEAPDITYGAADYTIKFVAPYDPDDITVNREIPHIKFLEKNGFRVDEFWPPNKLGAVGQDTIDMLNAADLVIIGRSGGSTNFQNAVDVNAWDSLTSPQVLVCQWKARRSRLKWFNSTAAGHENTEPETAIGKIADPSDIVFSNVSLEDDSTMDWFTPPPHDFIRNDSTTNGEILATWDTNGILLARFDAGTPFYVGAVDTSGTPQGPRSYFGMGNDDTNVGGVKWPNFFPLTNEAQQVYFNELCRLLNVGVSKVATVSGDARLMNITSDPEGELTPAFHKDSMEYVLVIDTTTVEIEAVTNNDMATILGGDSAVTVTTPGPDGAVTIYLLVEAENGVRKAYELTIQLFHTDVQEIHSDATLRIYPNPATDMLNISSENYINRVTIYNVIGQVVMDQTYRNNNHIVLNVSSLKSGLYLIKVGEGKDAIMGKFLIE